MRLTVQLGADGPRLATSGSNTLWKEAIVKARDVMTEHPQAVTPSDPLSHAAALMRDGDLGFVPVVEDRETRRLVGVITDRDIAIRHVAAAHDEDCAIKQHMTANPLITVAPDAPTSDVHSLMVEHQVRRVAVVDSDGHLLGVIAQADVATKEGRDKETGQIVERISESRDPLR
jgi:CBS domain-containing protein